jgi:DNA-binding response OmpR family regulator
MGPEAAAPRPKIVVINHDSAFLWILQELLHDRGYEALVPPKLDDLFPFIREARPDAVVLDAPFRQETAVLGVLDKLRLDPSTAATPVVICSTTPDALQGLARREAEGLYLLAKPFHLAQLLAVLAVALRTPPPQR